MINVHMFDNSGIIITKGEFIVIIDGKIFGPYPATPEYYKRILKIFSEIK